LLPGRRITKTGSDSIGVSEHEKLRGSVVACWGFRDGRVRRAAANNCVQQTDVVDILMYNASRRIGNLRQLPAGIILIQNRIRSIANGLEFLRDSTPCVIDERF
jgi:hypothetical protein